MPTPVVHGPVAVRMKEKRNLPLDKRAWHPSPLLGQVVLVTTCNEDGTSNVAPKSWVSMMALDPPVLAIGCNLEHWTARNILRSGEFVVNVPGADLVQVVWACHGLPHPRPVEAAGLTPLPSRKVRPPKIEECKAHLECTLDRVLTYRREVVLLGRIVAVSVDAEALRSSDPYSYLRMFVFLEGGTWGVVERGHRLPVTGPDR